jgi:hypothetical protein
MIDILTELIVIHKNLITSSNTSISDDSITNILKCGIEYSGNRSPNLIIRWVIDSNDEFKRVKDDNNITSTINIKLEKNMKITCMAIANDKILLTHKFNLTGLYEVIHEEEDYDDTSHTEIVNNNLYWLFLLLLIPIIIIGIVVK